MDGQREQDIWSTLSTRGPGGQSRATALALGPYLLPTVDELGSQAGKQSKMCFTWTWKIYPDSQPCMRRAECQQWTTV
jgi:hypothetical protein